MKQYQVMKWKTTKETGEFAFTFADAIVIVLTCIPTLYYNSFEVLLDPSPYEESLAKSQHIFAFAFVRDANTNTLESSLVYNESRGSHSGKDYLDVMGLCREASKMVLETIRANTSNQL